MTTDEILRELARPPGPDGGNLAFGSEGEHQEVGDAYVYLLDKFEGRGDYPDGKVPVPTVDELVEKFGIDCAVAGALIVDTRNEYGYYE